jgi:hypothetical protein
MTWLDSNVAFVIPANPTGYGPPDPNKRDQVALISDPIDDPRWNSREMVVTHDKAKKELHFHFFARDIRGAEFNRALGYYRELLGGDNVSTLVLWLSGETVGRQLGQLRVNGYERHESRERVRSSQLCFVGPARQWFE